MKDLKSIIAEHPVFRGITPQYLDILATHARETEFKTGQIILHQGQAAFEVYLITEGKVVVEAQMPKGDGLLALQVLGGGDVLGWSWLFPPFRWHFQGRALEPTKAIVLDGAQLLVACEKDPGLGYQLMNRVAQVVVRRLQSTRKRLVQLYQTDGSLAPIETTRFFPAIPGTGTKTLQTLLSEHPFLKGMSTQHIAILAEAAMQTQFSAGQVVFREGEMANRVYLIQHGRVLVQLPGTESRAVPIQMIGDGDVLGWSWLVPPYYWHFDACAIEPTTAIFLYGTRLREECETDNELGYQLMKRVAQVLIQRLQATHRQLLALHASRQPAPLGT